jgi:hypothetical protein
MNITSTKKHLSHCIHRQQLYAVGGLRCKQFARYLSLSFARRDSLLRFTYPHGSRTPVMPAQAPNTHLKMLPKVPEGCYGRETELERVKLSTLLC